MIFKSILIAALVCAGTVFLFQSCKNNATGTVEESAGDSTALIMPRTPEWHRNATIYEVNLRHYTPEGTFASFEQHIARLKEMGIDILWFMPIHEVSVKERKGELGSPYAVTDYRGVNPDMGTMDDFKHMLAAIQAAGMHCIIDWVPNHTGWDSKWITEHPDWYTHDADGNVTDPINAETGESWGWTDVADLNYDNAEMRLAMIDAMKFWVEDIGIDGFRVDVAHGVPVDFWVQCATALYEVKPLFMLAEAEVPELLNTGAFQMDYGWEMHHTLNEIAKSQGANRDAAKKLVQGNLVEGEDAKVEKKTALDIDVVLAKKAKVYTKGYHMQFTSNHDENSWAGTEFARMGDGHKAFAVLTATFDGMPLVYSGQESAMDKQLEFFKKDEIPWGDYAYAGFYKTLFDLKHRNKALWNGVHGGPLVKIPTGNDENVYAFSREKDGDKVVVIINLSAVDQEIKLQGSGYAGNYNNVFSNSSTELAEGMTLKMGSWDYLVLSSK
ncbi:MAG: alpha-glucosidase C-terminal domain-containing protein [Saprospiraceae bacterium]|nr:alpha-glucosidase C-terminal domain-containing protein [Saprospiraceae bacterium]